jgi:hypothetical protein
MSWASWIASRTRRRRAQGDDRERLGRCRLELDRECCAAGEAVAGDVVGLADSASVTLFRVERRADRYRPFKVADARVARPKGAFQLIVPRAALPSTSGKQCALSYIVRAQTADGAVCADLVVIASASPHLDEGSWRADRLLANWDARHFHIELADARLEGGGRLAGRIHRHGRWATDVLVVKARCLESWRSPVMASPRPPQWYASPLWEHAVQLRVDPDANWAPFVFHLPDGLPLAVEASTIAWRYELLAQRNVPHWFNETAAVTPLLHEHVGPRS